MNRDNQDVQDKVLNSKPLVLILSILYIPAEKVFSGFSPDTFFYWSHMHNQNKLFGPV